MSGKTAPQFDVSFRQRSRMKVSILGRNVIGEPFELACLKRQLGTDFTYILVDIVTATKMLSKTEHPWSVPLTVDNHIMKRSNERLD